MMFEDDARRHRSMSQGVLMGWLMVLVVGADAVDPVICVALFVIR